MVPVMAGGIVLGGKSYGFFEYLQASGSSGGGGSSSYYGSSYYGSSYYGFFE